ncbi:MAG TPA: hypothetical protein QF873_00125 [Patescibacteria group bacterium]|nr:hypothetical protein [Patescibacteria group bacterium]
MSRELRFRRDVSRDVAKPKEQPKSETKDKDGSLALKETFTTEPVGEGSSISGGSREETSRTEVFELKADGYQETGEPIDVDPAEESPEFNVKEVEQTLRTRADELFETPIVDAFFEDIHPDNFTTMVRVLKKYRTQGAESMRGLSGVMAEQLAKKATVLRGEELKDEKTLESKLKAFRKEFDTFIDSQISRTEILGTEDDVDVGIDRMDKLRAQSSKIGRADSLDLFLRNIMRRTIKSMQREAKQRQAEVAIEKKEEVEGAQEWLDQDREAAYAELIKQFKVEEAKGPDAIKEWFAAFVNPAIEAKGAPPISTEDLKSLMFIEVTSDSASEIAGQDINRPVILFQDIGEFQRFSIKVQGEKGMASRGMNIAPSAFDKDSIYAKTGLLIGTPMVDFIGHEVRHSIDPHVGQREGYNAILDEAFAYYHDEVATKDRSPEQAFNALRANFGSDFYYEHFAVDAETPLTREQYGELTGEVVDMIRSLKESVGDVEAQRAVVQAKTIDELRQLVRR